MISLDATLIGTSVAPTLFGTAVGVGLLIGSLVSIFNSWKP